MTNDRPLTLSEIPMPSTSLLERQIIYDAVNNPETIGDIAEIVAPKMFSDETVRGMWGTVCTMFHNGDAIDFQTVFAKVGQPFIDEVVTKGLQVSTPQAALQHSGILRSASMKRNTYFSALQLLQMAANATTPDDAIFDATERLSQNLQADSSEESEKPISEVLNTIASEVQERHQLTLDGKAIRVRTGFPSLDRLTYGGFGPGQLVIIAARPSVGKTSVMLKMVKSAAEAGFPACVFSAEMTNSELGQKTLYSTTHVSPDQVMSGDMDWSQFEMAYAELAKLPIYINDHTKNINEIISRITINARRGKCKIAFIDYLGLLDGIDPKIPLNQAIGCITRALKNTAKKAGIPIVVLCQLNREIVKENRPPQLTDLRDSGSIEQDADIVLMLAQLIAQEGQTPDVAMWVRKNRNFKKDVSITIRPNDTYSDFYEITDERFVGSEVGNQLYGSNEHNDLPL